MELTVIAEGANSWGTVIFSGSVLIAIPIAMLAGLVSFASPCVLPLVPGYLGYLTSLVATDPATAASPGRATPGSVAAAMMAVGTQAATQTAEEGAVTNATRASSSISARPRLVLGVTLFIAGFTAVFVSLGVFFGTMGQFLLRWDGIIERVLGLVVIVMGLAFIGAVPALQRSRRLKLPAATGLWGAPLLGVAFGLGWTPCLGPTLTAINALALGGGSPLRGGVLAVAYGLGLGVPFVLVAFSVGSSQRIMGVLRRHRRAIALIGGGMLIALGLAMVTGLWGQLAGAMQAWISGFETVI